MAEERAILCWLATVDCQSRPNVSPKEIYVELDASRTLIADIASGRSVKNIRGNPAVCVSLIDVFLQRGRKLEGMAEIVAPDHSSFAALAAPLMQKAGSAFTIRHVIVVTVESATPILAPSYVVLPDRHEADIRGDAYRAYGVHPMTDPQRTRSPDEQT